MDEKSKKGLRLLRVILLVLLLILAAAITAYLLWERAPEVTAKSEPMVIAVSRPGTRRTDAEAEKAGRTRKEGVYTLLLAGLDDGNGNTDTMMVARLDTNSHSLDVVSLPRDTMVNASWDIRKLNAAYAIGALNGGSGAESLCRHVGKLMGFEADSYAFVNLQAFVDVIDAMGGVDFEVPVAMDYEDLGQNLRIHLRPGYQHLDGYQAMGLCRFRSGYVNADLGRIEMQQQFLKACAEQFITLGNIPNVSKVVDILSKNLETDLSGGNIAWFLRQLLKCDSGNIRFHTAPSWETGMNGYSYTVLELDPWLEMVNTCLNPYQEAITAEDLDLVYSRGGSIGCTRERRFSFSDAPQVAVPAMETPVTTEAEIRFEPEEAIEPEPEGPQIVVVDLNEENTVPEREEPGGETVPEENADEPTEPDAAETSPETEPVISDGEPGIVIGE